MHVSKVGIFEAGNLTDWDKFEFLIPGLPPAAKCFLNERLGMNGMEVSLNSMKPGTAMPFFHRHRENEELYIFLSGNGEFQADGERIQVSAGTCIYCAPPVSRSWRNNGETDLQFIVVQAPKDKAVASTISDGEAVDDGSSWD